MSSGIKWPAGSLRENLERYSDVAMWALPTAVALGALATGHHIQALSMLPAGLCQDRVVKWLKINYPKERPEPFHGPGTTHKKDKQSFPSSHTAGAFLSVGLSASLYGLTSPVTVTSLALATLVG